MRGLLHIFTRWNDVLGHINTSGWVEVEYTNTFYPVSDMDIYKSAEGECYIEYIRGGTTQTIYLAPGQTYDRGFPGDGKIKVRYRDVKSLSLKLTNYPDHERTIVIV